MKGIFYKRLAEQEEIERAFPMFSLKKPASAFEFPKIVDIKKANIVYPLVEPFAYANIQWDPKIKELIYRLVEPELTRKEVELLKKISEGLIDLIEVELSAIRKPQTAVKYLDQNTTKVIREFGLSIASDQYAKIMYYIYRNFIGFNEIEPLLQDPNIEDISCDGVNVPVYVVHRKFGSLKTNITFGNLEQLREFVVKLAERCGRYVSFAEPILSGTLPDGSRISANVARDIATRGPVFTIRKFGEKPLSPVDQIEFGTASAKVLAYLWYLTEHGASILIAGGTATGKTSFLNSMCMFIPPEAKIVSIEDTREIRIPHVHWAPGLARTGFGMPLPSGEKYGGVTLFDLLKESFRQNPDYVIVGETRGPEAYVMFQGMASGHTCFSTFHAGSLDTLIKRLITPPIELPPGLMESLDTVILMVHAKKKGKSARRIKEVIEIESIDLKTQEVKPKIIFKWNPEADSFEKIEDSIKIKKIVATTGGKMEDALVELERRESLLEWFRKNKIRDYLEVTRYINMYYKEPKKLFKMVEKGMKIPAEVEAKKRPRRLASIFERLGFRAIKEK